MNVREFASLGGRARARRLHPDRRSEIAREAARVSWQRRRERERKSKDMFSKIPAS